MQSLEVSGAVRLIYRSLGVKGLISYMFRRRGAVLRKCFRWSEYKPNATI